MTHQEAIKNLDTMWKMLTKAYDEIPDSFVMAFTKAINALKAETEPNYDEWCTDCKEYDKERHCCPRWNRVIRETLDEVRRKNDERLR